MLTVYKRHNVACPHRVRSYRRCDCPCWVEGTVEGRYFRESLNTRNWTRATEIVRQKEQSGGITKGKVTVEQATVAFIADAKARGLQPSSVYKYELMLKQLREFCADKGLDYIAECDVENLRAFRESWKNKNFSARKKLEALRTFFRFVHDTGWLATNPAKLIRPPKTNDVPTMPFTQEEFKSVIAACDKYFDKANAVRLRALTLVLRYSGLRISDAVTLMKDKIKDEHPCPSHRQDWYRCPHSVAPERPPSPKGNQDWE
jgi:integrase/recombinase XerD